MVSFALQRTFASWAALASSRDLHFVDSIYAAAERNYEAGGDIVIETYTPAEILEEFSSLEEAQEFFGFRIDSSE